MREPEARRELRAPGTSFIASVGYFPEKYGPELIRLALVARSCVARVRES